MKALVILKNGMSVKRITKVVKCYMPLCYETYCWFEDHDKRIAKLVGNGYMIDSITYSV